MESSPPLFPDFNDQLISNGEDQSLMKIKFDPLNEIQLDYFLAKTNLIASKLICQSIKQITSFQVSVKKQKNYNPNKIDDYFGQSSVNNELLSQQQIYQKSQDQIYSNHKNHTQAILQENQSLFYINSAKNALKMFQIAKKIKLVLMNGSNVQYTNTNIKLQKSLQKSNTQKLLKVKKFNKKVKLANVQKYKTQPTNENLTQIINNLQISHKTFLGWVKKYELLDKRQKLINEIHKLFNLRNKYIINDDLRQNKIIDNQIPKNFKITKNQFRGLAKQIYQSKNFGAIDRWCRYFIKNNNLENICEI